LSAGGQVTSIFSCLNGRKQAEVHMRNIMGIQDNITPGPPSGILGPWLDPINKIRYEYDRSISPSRYNPGSLGLLPGIAVFVMSNMTLVNPSIFGRVRSSQVGTVSVNAQFDTEFSTNTLTTNAGAATAYLNPGAYTNQIAYSTSSSPDVGPVTLTSLTLWNGNTPQVVTITILPSSATMSFLERPIKKGRFYYVFEFTIDAPVTFDNIRFELFGIPGTLSKCVGNNALMDEIKAQLVLFNSVINANTIAMTCHHVTNYTLSNIAPYKYGVNGCFAFEFT